MEKPTFKRFFDITISLFLIIILSPYLIIVALAVRITSNGPALFIQKRVGFRGKTFKMLKFRTMVVNAQELKIIFTPEQLMEFQLTYKLKDDPRITPLGKLLRKTSIDELPQLFNVLKGDMSLVGPRPVTKEELKMYGDNTETILSLLPGITGLWQVSGRNNVSYEERISLDITYAEKNNFILDLKIILETVKVVILCLGAY